MKVNLPLTEEALEKMRIGEKYELSGTIYTARDAAHKRFIEALEKGEQTLDFQDIAIFYTGPCPPRPGMAIGSIGATTSNRMDPYIEPLLKEGMKVMIGKGARDPKVAELCKQYKAVYLMVYGGIAALYSKAVKSAQVVCFDDLGTEAVRKLKVEDFRVIVATDACGQVLQDVCTKPYIIVE